MATIMNIIVGVLIILFLVFSSGASSMSGLSDNIEISGSSDSSGSIKRSIQDGVQYSDYHASQTLQ